MTLNDECPICEEGTLIEHSEIRKTQPVHYPGLTVTVESFYATCDVCRSEIADADQINRNAANMKAAIKEALDGKL